MLVKALMLDIYTADVFKFHTDQKPLSTHLLNVWECPQQIHKVGTHAFGILCKMFVLHLPNGCQRCCAAHRMSAKGRTVGTGAESLSDFVSCTDRTDRHTTAKCLCHGNDVGLDAIVHEGHPVTGPAPACLYLIEQQEQSILVAELTKPCHKFRSCRIHTTLALHRLDHDGDGVFIAGSLECFQIVVWCIGKSRCHITKSYLTSIIRLSGR